MSKIEYRGEISSEVKNVPPEKMHYLSRLSTLNYYEKSYSFFHIIIPIATVLIVFNLRNLSKLQLSVFIYCFGLAWLLGLTTPAVGTLVRYQGANEPLIIFITLCLIYTKRLLFRNKNG